MIFLQFALFYPASKFYIFLFFIMFGTILISTTTNIHSEVKHREKVIHSLFKEVTTWYLAYIL